MIPAGLAGLSVRQWVQLGAAVVALIVLVVLGITVIHWRSEAAKVPGLQQEIVAYEQSIERLTRDVEASRQASAGFQQELERLRAARTVVPARPVRVCRDAPVSAGTGGSAGAGPDEGSAAGGLVPQEPGPDIGPDLYGAADRADELSAQIRGLHEYVREVCRAEKAGT